MTKPQSKVIVYVFAHKETAETRVIYISDCAGGNQAAELWCGKDTERCFIFHQDAFYDEKLRTRRRDENMISTTAPIERLVHIGDVWGGCLPKKRITSLLASQNFIFLSYPLVEGQAACALTVYIFLTDLKGQ